MAAKEGHPAHFLCTSRRGFLFASLFASESSDHSLKLDESNPSGLPPPDSIMSESQFFQGRSTSLKRLSAVTEADEDDSEEEDKQKEN